MVGGPLSQRAQIDDGGGGEQPSERDSPSLPKHTPPPAKDYCLGVARLQSPTSKTLEESRPGLPSSQVTSPVSCAAPHRPGDPSPSDHQQQLASRRDHTDRKESSIYRLGGFALGPEPYLLWRSPTLIVSRAATKRNPFSRATEPYPFPLILLFPALPVQQQPVAKPGRIPLLLSYSSSHPPEAPTTIERDRDIYQHRTRSSQKTEYLTGTAEPP